MRVFRALLLMALIIAQFFRPTRNPGTIRGTTHISEVYPVPAGVEGILEKPATTATATKHVTRGIPVCSPWAGGWPTMWLKARKS